MGGNDGHPPLPSRFALQDGAQRLRGGDHVGQRWDNLDKKMKKVPHHIKGCRFCNRSFQPMTSRNSHYAPECRCRDIAEKFSDDFRDCWEWSMSRMKQTGYGQFTVKAIPQYLETDHRMSWLVFRGEIPATFFPHS